MTRRVSTPRPRCPDCAGVMVKGPAQCPFCAVSAQCRAVGLPEPVAEYEFAKAAGRKWRFDLAWIEWRVAVDVCGGAFIPGGGRHNRGQGYVDDLARSNAAQLHGWIHLVFTPQQVAAHLLVTVGVNAALMIRGYVPEGETP